MRILLWRTAPAWIQRPAPQPNQIAACRRPWPPREPATRQFLSYADGWPSFYFDLDLFGLPELRDRTGNATLAQRLLADYTEEGILDMLSLPADRLVPIGAGTGMRDLLLLVVGDGPNAGRVSWLDGEEVDRYDSFTEYLAAMIA